MIFLQLPFSLDSRPTRKLGHDPSMDNIFWKLLMLDVETLRTEAKSARLEMQALKFCIISRLSSAPSIE